MSLSLSSAEVKNAGAIVPHLFSMAYKDAISEEYYLPGCEALQSGRSERLPGKYCVISHKMVYLSE